LQEECISYFLNILLIGFNVDNYIKLNNCAVSFKIYGAQDLSLKKQIFSKIKISKLIGKFSSSVTVDALSGISFALKNGDRLGVIGGNGAGKSTLLRLLAGVYEPNVGLAKINGKIISIIEPSIGMDPFLTGYENIVARLMLLAGDAKLDMPKITQRVEDICQLGEFLNLPIHTYSTGMIMRLNFAISISIDPEILLLDEWLSVADKDFTEIASHEMKGFVARSGIMVLASHNLDLISQNCNLGLVLCSGKQFFFGGVEEALNVYQEL
jgi:ABC-type polysaccharide/polyol phosphate transport system ATPase subunit